MLETSLLLPASINNIPKVPATILSRCQRFSFRRISQEDIAARLQYVSYQENIDLDDSAARVLARLADGGMRDGLSLLDQCASATQGELTSQKVYDCLGIAGERRCGELLLKIASRDTAGVLSLFNTLYSQGKDLSAMLDELACLVRDLLVLKSAPGQGIAMLSGVAEDGEAKQLAAMLSGGELLRMMELLQKTLASFSRNASRRTDAELCILEMCQPEMSRDSASMNARLTRLEEMVKSGSFTAVQPVPEHPEAPPQAREEAPAAPEMPEAAEAPAAPMGFWQDLTAAVREELKPPAKGFFSPNPNGPIHGVLSGEKLELVCADRFTAEMVSKPEVLEVVTRKAAAILGRQITASVADRSHRADGGEGMRKLMEFGRANPDIVKIKRN